MRRILALIASTMLSAPADTVSWTTYTGWDHGYNLTVDGADGTIALVERLAEGKDGARKVERISGSVAFVAYVKNLMELLPEGELGPSADDGSIIEVNVKSGGRTLTREINFIELYINPRYLGSTDDPKGENIEKAKISKVTLREVTQFKKWTEAYMLQQKMFDLKERYFEKLKAESDK